MHRSDALQMIGAARCHVVACSTAWANRSTVRSSSHRPVIIEPIGRPALVKPHGIEMEGWPVRSKMPVFIQALRPQSSRRFEIGAAVIVAVGATRKTHSDINQSICVTN